LLELFVGIFGPEPQQLDSLRFEADLAEQPPYGGYTDFGAVVSLREAALPLGASHHTQPMAAAFKGRHQILGVDLAAARNFADHNMRVVMLPLPGQPTSLGNTIPTEKDNHIWWSTISHINGFP